MISLLKDNINTGNRDTTMNDCDNKDLKQELIRQLEEAYSTANKINSFRIENKLSNQRIKNIMKELKELMKFISCSD